jgi:predicted peptidase
MIKTSKEDKVCCLREGTMKKRGIVTFLTIIIIAICVAIVLFSVIIYTDIAASATANTSSTHAKNPTTEVPELKPEGTSASSYYGYTAHVFTDAQGNSLHYYLYIPSNYNPAQKYPLVLLLHGGGERSNPSKTAEQNEQVLLNDPYAQVWSADYNAPGNPHIQQRWPCFVVIPQLSTGQNWVNVPVNGGSYSQPAQPSAGLLVAKEILDALQKEYRGIDANRLYVTGLSNGGYGTWDAIERWPNYFAAAAPIAGAGDPSKADVLKNLPIWAFHGSADTTVPVSGSRDMIAAIEAAGGHPRYTEFPGLGHGIWGFVYGLNTGPQVVTDFFPWLFSQHK